MQSKIPSPPLCQRHKAYTAHVTQAHTSHTKCLPQLTLARDIQVLECMLMVLMCGSLCGSAQKGPTPLIVPSFDLAKLVYSSFL
mgnify:CR=1 FL=1